jgi:hypothetical protein
LYDTPLGSLTNEYTFAVNRIAKIFDKTFWRPSFFVSTSTSLDQFFYIAMREAIIANFVWDANMPTITDQAYDIYKKENLIKIKCSEAGQIQPKEADVKFFSFDAEKRVSKYGSAIFAVVQIAAYMGFSPLYFVGCDCNMSELTYDYYTDSEKQRRANLDIVTPILKTHVLINEACKGYSIKLFNATIGGDLEVYDRVDLTKVLADWRYTDEN